MNSCSTSIKNRKSKMFKSLDLIKNQKSSNQKSLVFHKGAADILLIYFEGKNIDAHW